MNKFFANPNNHLIITLLLGVASAAASAIPGWGALAGPLLTAAAPFLGAGIALPSIPAAPIPSQPVIAPAMPAFPIGSLHATDYSAIAAAMVQAMIEAGVIKVAPWVAKSP